MKCKKCEWWDTDSFDGICVECTAKELDEERKKVKVLRDALKPLALCDVAKFRSIPDSEIWLWKPQSNSGQLPGINREHVINARKALSATEQNETP